MQDLILVLSSNDFDLLLITYIYIVLLKSLSEKIRFFLRLFKTYTEIYTEVQNRYY